MSGTIEVPEIVALCRDDEEQAIGWAMIIPQTNKVVAYVPGRTGIGSGLLGVYSSPEGADRILTCTRIYPVPDWPDPDNPPRTRCCPTCTCAVITELTTRG
ncbi:MAG: hypothetical protein ACT4NY_09350 [Pseudonocardiales bacterium]